MSLTDQDVRETIDFLDSRGIIRKNKPLGQWYSIYCPYHNNGNEKKPSCGINLIDTYSNGKRTPPGLLHCFTCGTVREFPDFIKDMISMKNISVEDREWLQNKIKDLGEVEYEKLIPEGMLKQMQSSMAIKYIKKMSDIHKTEYVSESELAQYRYTVEYHRVRHLTDEAIIKYDVGFDPGFIPPGRKKPVPCITMPVRDKTGGTLFIVRRSLEGKAFYLPSGVRKPVYGLYELDPNCKSIVICESCLNTISAHIFGYQSVALLGTGDDYQIQQLRHLGVRNFVLALDPDEAGNKGRIRLKKKLSDVALISELKMPPGKDVNDCTKEEFDEIYKNMY